MTSSTSRSAYGFLFVAIVFEVIATLSLKAALTQPWLYAMVVIGYVAAFVCLDQVLRRGMKIGVAYGIWGALGVAATALLAPVLFGEPLTLQILLGLVLIIIGVLCIELGGSD